MGLRIEENSFLHFEVALFTKRFAGEKFKAGEKLKINMTKPNHILHRDWAIIILECFVMNYFSSFFGHFPQTRHRVRFFHGRANLKTRYFICRWIAPVLLPFISFISYYFLLTHDGSGVFVKKTPWNFDIVLLIWSIFLFFIKYENYDCTI